MKRLVAGLLAAAVVALSACGNQDQPIDVMTPTPWGTAAPTATGTPSQAELSAMAEKTYRAAFEEWKRIERGGGAHEVTPRLRQHADGAYLNSIEMALRHQKDHRIQIEGPIPSTSVLGEPGQSRDDSDPRMTLRVCEDNTASVAKVDGKEIQGTFVEGTVYLGERAGRIKVISSSTSEVTTCSS